MNPSEKKWPKKALWQTGYIKKQQQNKQRKNTSFGQVLAHLFYIIQLGIHRLIIYANADDK